MLNLFNGQQNRAAYGYQGLAAELCRSDSSFLEVSIGLPRYADCNNDDDERDLYLLSDNEKGLLRLSVSNEAIGRSTRVFLVVRKELRSFAIAM